MEAGEEACTQKIPRGGGREIPAGGQAKNQEEVQEEQLETERGLKPEKDLHQETGPPLRAGRGGPAADADAVGDAPLMVPFCHILLIGPALVLHLGLGG